MPNNVVFDKQTHSTLTLDFSLSLISLAIFAFHPFAQAESLEQINVVDESSVNSTVGSKSYTIKSMNTVTGLRISGKDKPQSVSVVTRKQLDDRAIHTLEDAMKNTTGVNIVHDSGLQTRFLSRGFYVDQIGSNWIKLVKMVSLPM